MGMFFIALCIGAVLFLAFTLPGALRCNREESEELNLSEPPILDSSLEQQTPYWRRDNAASAHATDEFEYLDMQARHEQNPHVYPSPLLPPSRTKQHDPDEGWD